MSALLDDFRYVEIPGALEMHMVHPHRYIDELVKFVGDGGLRTFTPVPFPRLVSPVSRPAG